MGANGLADPAALGLAAYPVSTSYLITVHKSGGPCCENPKAWGNISFWFKARKCVKQLSSFPKRKTFHAKATELKLHLCRLAGSRGGFSKDLSSGGCGCVCVCEVTKSFQSRPTVCDPIDSSPPGSSVHGVLQARILEWVAMPSSRGSFRPGD